MGEEKFNKKKRNLTEKQKLALAEGRKKMAIKRNMEKKQAREEGKEEKKRSNLPSYMEMDEEFNKVADEQKLLVETRKRQEQERERKKKTLDEQEELKIKNKLQSKRQSKIDNFKLLKYKYMNKCKTLKEMRDFKDMIDGIDEDMLENTEKLRSFFKHKLQPFFYKIEGEGDLVKKGIESPIMGRVQIEPPKTENVKMEINETNK